MLDLQTKSLSDLYRFGYYRVGEEIFSHKMRALIRATQVNKTPTWHYHEDVYSKLNWTQDVTFDLDHIYQQRAKQLRERYDYLCLGFSGGSDSWTALKAFVDSGTHLDEIMTRQPFKGLSGKYELNPNNKDPTNVMAEWDFTVLPMLTEIQKFLPKTRITVYDYTDDLFTLKITDEDWISMVPADWFNVGSLLKWQCVSEHEQRAIDKNLSTAFITGIDKPQLRCIDGKVYCYFLDMLANTHAPDRRGRVNEQFYWTPDMPEITLAQARALYKAICHNPKISELIDAKKKYSGANKNLWNQFARPIVYGEYDKLNTFQTQKPLGATLRHSDSWMEPLTHTAYVHSWQVGVNNLFKSIDPKYFKKAEGRYTGFTGFISGDYYLGDLNGNTLVVQ